MYLVVLPKQEGGGLVDSHGHKFNKTAVEAAVARDGMSLLAPTPILIKGDSGERQTVGDLGTCFQRQLSAEDVPDSAIQDVAVWFVENRIQLEAGHGCWFEDRKRSGSEEDRNSRENGET
jgi:hypothetical protein